MERFMAACIAVALFLCVGILSVCFLSVAILAIDAWRARSRRPVPAPQAPIKSDTILNLVDNKDAA